jgi:glycosyltransferase involved in cell wall biosynthesis
VVATAQHGWDLARHLVREGNEVTAIASRSRYGERGASLPDEERIEGVRIVRVGSSMFGRSALLPRMIDFAMFFLRAIWCAMTLPRHDVCICFTTPPFIALVGWLLRCFRGTKFVYWVMDLYPDLPVACGIMKERSLVTRFFERMNRFCLRRADRVVVLGRCMEERVVAKGVDPSRIVLINVWSDQEEIKPIAREDNAFRREWGAGDKLVVMYSGNFGIGHDIETIADAVRRLSGDPGILFVFTGGGERKAELLESIRKAGVTNFIDRPYQPRERLGELLCAGDVHLASLRDGAEGIMVPSKVYGVLAAARPVVFIGSPTGEGARVIVEESCGTVIECGDGLGLAKAIQRYAAEPEEVEASGQRGRDALTRKWSASHALRKWSILLRSVTNTPSRSCAEG